jgi:hypothetical protein
MAEDLNRRGDRHGSGTGHGDGRDHLVQLSWFHDCSFVKNVA